MSSKHTPGPEALRLADSLRSHGLDPGSTVRQDAAAELRRLHAQRAALLEALRLARSIIGRPDDAHSKFIDAAIAKAEGALDDENTWRIFGLAALAVVLFVALIAALAALMP